MDFSIVLVVAMVFVGAPLAVFSGISMLQRAGLDKKKLELERERLAVDKQKLRLMQLEAEYKLLDSKLENEFRDSGLTEDR